MPQLRPPSWQITFLVLIVLTGPVLAACSGNGTGNVITAESPRQISVSGHGEANTEPDTVILSLGVSVLRETVTEAITEAADLMTAVIRILRDQGVEETDIRTTNFAVFPQFDFNHRGERDLRGFSASNQISASLRDVHTAGALIDAAAKAGGDDVIINSISFAIDDPETLVDEARELAVVDARRKAEQFAALANVDLGDVISISEPGDNSRTPQIFARTTLDAATEFASTPIAPGQSNYSVHVFVVYELK